MRKAKPKKRVVLPDPVFNDQMVSKFVNHLMYDGKKNVSYTIFYGALDILGAKMKNEEKTPLEIWKQALENITPKVEVKSRRIGGATFQVPTEIRADRKESISMKNMILFARKRGGKSMAEKLCNEIESTIENCIRDVFLSVVHQMVNEFRYHLIAVNGIGKDHTFFWFCFSHFLSKIMFCLGLSLLFVSFNASSEAFTQPL